MTLQEILEKDRDERTALEQCIVDATRLEDMRDGDYTEIEKAVAELNDLIKRANDIEKGRE